MRRIRLAVFVHLIWGTWDRLPLVTSEIQREVYRGIGAKCEELHTEVIALGGVEDHVHLLVRIPSTISIAELVGQITGASAHLVTHRISPDTFFKWQGAYAGFSVSIGQIPKVRDYINHQREHHALGTVIPALELPAEDAEE